MKITELIEGWRFVLAVVFAVIIKFLIDGEPPPADETKVAASYRRRRQFGGVLAGLFLGLLGPDWMISWFEILTVDDRLMLGVGLALLGDHAFRAFIKKGPEILQAIAKRIFPNGPGQGGGGQ